ncbi:EAL domain-containing protein [Metabacillus litoralis]|uniref:EAL domain-containing protein n=1 Tax=Metabacillus litoralis TaxID=152268 RepID=UPI001CFE3449|nr:EAL domain-containing protein [Metabacillus litoralis]
MNNVCKEHIHREAHLKKEFLSILHDRHLSIYFQPIVQFHSKNTIFGFEALSRGPVDSFFHSPINLFPYAEKEGLLYSLEKLARERAFEESKGILKDKKLFINLNSQVVYDNKFNPGHTISLLHQYGLDPKNVVFEITERNAINDFAAFRNVLHHYREQGFQIAIDDAGAGYSSLQSISELMPDYIKVDRSLICGIDKSPVKSNILEAFVSFAKKMNSEIIAEGIETEAELKKVMELGIEFGQGFFIARPNNPTPPINEIAKQCMKLVNFRQKNQSIAVDISDEIVLMQNGIVISRQPARTLLNQDKSSFQTTISKRN